MQVSLLPVFFDEQSSAELQRYQRYRPKPMKDFAAALLYVADGAFCQRISSHNKLCTPDLALKWHPLLRQRMHVMVQKDFLIPGGRPGRYAPHYVLPVTAPALRHPLTLALPCHAELI
jgi:hypothetical protein